MTFDLSVALRFVQALDIDLADSLRAAHHIGRIDSFVGRDHHELPCPVLDSQIGQDLGPVNVVLDALGGVVLHHGDMLVSSGMEDNLRTEGTEYRLHTVGVGDAGHNR